jgi:hypothetical protein
MRRLGAHFDAECRLQTAAVCPCCGSGWCTGVAGRLRERCQHRLATFAARRYIRSGSAAWGAQLEDRVPEVRLWALVPARSSKIGAPGSSPPTLETGPGPAMAQLIAGPGIGGEQFDDALGHFVDRLCPGEQAVKRWEDVVTGRREEFGLLILQFAGRSHECLIGHDALITADNSEGR